MRIRPLEPYRQCLLSLPLHATPQAVTPFALPHSVSCCVADHVSQACSRQTPSQAACLLRFHLLTNAERLFSPNSLTLEHPLVRVTAKPAPPCFHPRPLLRVSLRLPFPCVRLAACDPPPHHSPTCQTGRTGTPSRTSGKTLPSSSDAQQARTGLVVSSCPVLLTRWQTPDCDVVLASANPPLNDAFAVVALTTRNVAGLNDASAWRQ